MRPTRFLIAAFIATLTSDRVLGAEEGVVAAPGDLVRARTQERSVKGRLVAADEDGVHLRRSGGRPTLTLRWEEILRLERARPETTALSETKRLVGGGLGVAVSTAAVFLVVPKTEFCPGYCGDWSVEPNNTLRVVVAMLAAPLSAALGHQLAGIVKPRQWERVSGEPSPLSLDVAPTREGARVAVTVRF